MNVVVVPFPEHPRLGAGSHSLGMDATMAFQPIVNVNTKTIYAYEALARGRHNEGAAQVLDSIDDNQREEFDRECTLKAIGLASLLKVPTRLAINLAAATTSERLLSFAKKAATSNGFFPSQLMFEVTMGRNAHNRQFHDRHDIQKLFDGCRQQGFLVVLDRFGTADSGLDLLSTFRPDIFKLSMTLVRDIHIYPMRRASVRGIAQVCSDMGILVVAAGVETAEECRALRDAGVHLCQGNCFAPPRFEGLPLIPPTVWPRIDRRSSDRTIPLLHSSTGRVHLHN